MTCDQDVELSNDYCRTSFSRWNQKIRVCLLSGVCPKTKNKIKTIKRILFQFLRRIITLLGFGLKFVGASRRQQLIPVRNTETLSFPGTQRTCWKDQGQYNHEGLDQEKGLRFQVILQKILDEQLLNVLILILIVYWFILCQQFQCIISCQGHS